jgi:peptidoglycan/LPS O-acetylase OafA/YrhL
MRPRESAARVHLGYLDGLRGWAALFVVFHHVWQFVIVDTRLGPVPRWFSVFTILKHGSCAVTIFIVLSGYCLMLPVARSADARFAGGLAGFLGRRARRILPAYYATLAVTISAVVTFPALGGPSGTQWDLALPALGAKNLALHVLLLHNLTRATEWKLDPPLWSVALEWQIYFVFALVLLPLYRRAGLVFAVVAGILLGSVPVVLGGGFASPWYIGSFALGMGAACVHFARSTPSAWRNGVSWRAVVFAFILPALAATLVPRLRGTPAALVDLCLSVATAAFLVRSTSNLLDGRRSASLRSLSHRWSKKLGAFSYSLYLIHYPIVAAVHLALRDRGLGVAGMFASLTLLAVPIALVTAYGFFYIFERPFLSKGTVAKPSAARADEGEELPEERSRIVWRTYLTRRTQSENVRWQKR